MTRFFLMKSGHLVEVTYLPRVRHESTTEREPTYPLRMAARLTGLSPELLRSWERRHQAVAPMRTAGGTRRYRAADLERLRLLKAAVDAGHRIGQVARWELDELRRSTAPSGVPAAGRLDAILDAIERLEDAETLRLLSLQLSALGPARFGAEIALPLLREIGDLWASRRIGVAHEHLASGALRSLLGATLQPTASSMLGPRIVFATPVGERHELGLLAAALIALGAGARPLYLGAELPVAELVSATQVCGAPALALALVAIPAAPARKFVTALRQAIPRTTQLWLGGAGANALGPLEGVEVVESLEAMERRVALLAIAR